MSRARLMWIGGLALAGLALAPLAARTPVLIWNASSSAPIGLYRLERGVAPAPGDRIAYRPTPELGRWLTKRGYLPAGAPLLKPVAVVAPSQVCRQGAQILIDGRTAAIARSRDRAGRPLPHWRGCWRLTSQTIFLLAPDVPDSLDGRYFGPTDAGAVMGRVVPIRTWEARP